jgi:hypothetical protein
MRVLLARGALPVVLALVATLFPAASATAATRVTPGSFTGFAFDTCQTPTSRTMDVWRRTSPFWGVGVYLGGVSSLCDRSNLTKAWVGRQSRRGWRVLPLWVGPQAACSTVGYAADIDTARRGGYAAAAEQGRRNANQAVRKARAIGVPPRSTLWYDIEDFALSDDDCRRSVLTFLSAWTKRLHRLGYTSGVYSNVSAAVDALDFASYASPGSYALPDQIWYAWGNGRADTHIDRRWVRGKNWTPHARVHQYALDKVVEYGGVELKIDRNFVDVGRGSVAPRAKGTCGVRLDFGDYRHLRRGARNGQVKAVQCLLKKKRMYDGRLHGRYTKATWRGVRTFQRSRDLRVTGRMDARTWTALLAQGPTPLVKRGSVGDSVRRVQRSLTAALDRRVRVSGVFRAGTTRAVRQYQRSRGVERTGVVTKALWADLKAGRR